ncbi:ATP-binding protein [Thermococcus sp. SY098]|uniref:ATP-binding protein n=1 Tax=Thermococcus sp. SY098 TaxID=3111325 RepID=UPI002D77C4A9|nr:ATP-binding protein [Thermococcus sp. SY098]WRS52481.1 ATP-binding protein [Thermococcus sp. SY098]
MISHFVNRKRELERLEREWKNVPSFVVVYGRRRIGKTRLLVEFSKNKNTFFHTFFEGTKESHIKALRKELAEFFSDEIFLSLNDYYTIFRYLADKIDAKTLIVLDEFTYALKGDKELASKLQRAWDHHLSKKPVMLVVSGSLIGMMRDEVLSYSSPLYGRRTAGFMLRPLGLFDSLELFENFEYGIRTYMLLGGIPSYLIVASKYRSIKELLKWEFLTPEGFFYDEPYILLSQELRELKLYFSILSAIAVGKTRISEIGNHIGVEARKLYPYLENLIRLGFVKREVPVIGKKNKGVYKLNDPMLLTWFSMIYPHKTEIETGVIDIENLRDELKKVMALRFEEVAKEFLVEINKRERLPFKFERIGRWWRKGEEIDLIALNEKERKALFVEVKWKDLNEREAKRILRDLELKAELVGLNGWEKFYGLVAKKVDDKKELSEEGFSVWDLADFKRFISLRGEV